MENAAKTKGKTAAQTQAGVLMSVVKAEGKKDGPTKQDIYDKAVELKWRLKRKKGKSPVQEMKRRQRVAGLYGRQWKMTNVKQSGTSIEIWMENRVKYAGTINVKKKTFSRAAGKTNTKYRARLQKLANQVTSTL
jgi:hypothetical protein